ncbi:hypothetical protein [Nitrosospira briensis]|uniref:hypothetical protein n=1 Tax=Nitrosospira briensis TaxID=35799 RepID=UPI0012E0F606|nr:hypothetical protein [Nitrosospira briensis]
MKYYSECLGVPYVDVQTKCAVVAETGARLSDSSEISTLHPGYSHPVIPQSDEIASKPREPKNGFMLTSKIELALFASITLLSSRHKVEPVAYQPNQSWRPIQRTSSASRLQASSKMWANEQNDRKPRVIFLPPSNTDLFEFE